MAKRQAAGDRGHPFPAPAWWTVAIGKVRDSMTDQQLIEAIEAQTGRTYSKFTISRYFTADNPTTTLELTHDLWLTFGVRYGIPRPVIVAETRAEAEKLSSPEDDALRADMRRLDARLRKDEARDQAKVVEPPSGEEDRRPRSPASGGGHGPGRRR